MSKTCCQVRYGRFSLGCVSPFQFLRNPDRDGCLTSQVCEQIPIIISECTPYRAFYVEDTYDFKFADKGRALERLEKHLGMYDKDREQEGGPRIFINAPTILKDVEEQTDFTDCEENSPEETP